MHKLPSLIALFSAAIFLSACSFTMTGDVTPPPGSEQLPIPQVTESVISSPVFPIVPPDLVNGARIYNQECVECHGTQGLGDGVRAPQLSAPVAALGLSDFARQYTPAEWYTVVTHGSVERFMPAFTKLTDRQRWDVVAYAMNLSTTNELIAQGREIYLQNCATCHGVSGEGDGPGVVKLSTPLKNLTDQSYMAQISAASLFEIISTGVAPDMPSFADSLNENQRWSVAAYLRNLTYETTGSSAEANPSPESNQVSTPAAPTEVSSTLTETQSPGISSTTATSPTNTFTGNVIVQLINGSGGETSSDASVTLYGFDSMQNTYTDTLTVGVSGVYTFTNVAMPEGRVFLAGADYASGYYGSDIVTVDPASPNLNLKITVYDTTTEISALTTDRAHIFFDFSDPENVQIIEVFIISNSSNKAVVGATPNGPVVTFPLPKGYTNLQFQKGELGDRYIEVSQGFADTMTVSPGVGDYQLIFWFQMPYNRKLEFAQSMYLPTNAVIVLIPDSEIKVNSKLLQDSGVEDFQGSKYHMYKASSMIANSTLEFTLSGKPNKIGTPVLNTGTTQNLSIGLGAFGIVLIAVGVWLYRKNRLKVALQQSGLEMGGMAPEFQLNALPEDEETLMDAIITLDDQYHEGNLPEDAYLERRAVLKEKLKQLDDR